MAYIDKDLLLKDIGESVVFTVRNAETSPELRGARKIIDRIKNAPATDVVEVKHGEWQECFEDWRKQIVGDECSICNFRHYGTSISHYHYCPNCGAKMDGTPKERGGEK